MRTATTTTQTNKIYEYSNLVNDVSMGRTKRRPEMSMEQHKRKWKMMQRKYKRNIERNERGRVLLLLFGILENFQAFRIGSADRWPSGGMVSMLFSLRLESEPSPSGDELMMKTGLMVKTGGEQN